MRDTSQDDKSVASRADNIREIIQTGGMIRCATQKSLVPNVPTTTPRDGQKMMKIVKIKKDDFDAFKSF